MNLYVNYERAQQRLDSDDLSVVRLLCAVHQSMLRNTNIARKPFFPFDMDYYYDSLVRSLADGCSHPARSLGRHGSDILAVNVPHPENASWQETPFAQMGIAEKYIRIVQSESQPGGTPFDLGFACAIAADAIDERVLMSVGEAVGKRIDPPADPFDDWLRGFTNPE